MQKLIVILGPTASGKSDLAVALALWLNSGQAKKFGVTGAEIISADSRQVYKGLDIGTGKITKKEMKGVKHYLLDVCSPKYRFTVSDFVKLTNSLIGKIVIKNKIPVICGGTGFYIDALLGDKQIPEVPPNPKIRKRLEKKSAEELFKILQKLDPERAAAIDSHNPRRLVRAIEICHALGGVPKFGYKNSEPGDRKYDVIKIGIKVEEKKLKKMINKRIEKWFKKGLIKEVQNLHKKGLSWKRMGEIGLEYKIVANYLQKKTRPPFAEAPQNKAEMMEKMQKETWKYAKRQMTWFKKDKNILWFKPKINPIQNRIIKFLK